MKNLSRLFAAIALIALPASAQGKLVPTRPPIPEFPQQASSLGIGGCCKTVVITGENGSVSEVHTLCNDPLFEASARRAARKMRFEPKTDEGGSTAGLRHWRNIAFQMEGFAAAQCPTQAALEAQMNGAPAAQLAATATAPPPALDFAGTCGARPALSPASLSGIASLDRSRINPAGDKWRSLRDWSSCRSAQYEAVAAAVRAHWSGRMIEKGSEDERGYLAAVDQLLGQSDALRQDRKLLNDYVDALNARADTLEAEDRARPDPRPIQRYGRASSGSGGMTAADAFYDAQSAAPHQRCIEDAYTEQQRMRCMDNWLGVEVPPQ